MIPEFFNSRLLHTVEVWRWFGEWLDTASAAGKCVVFYLMQDRERSEVEAQRMEDVSGSQRVCNGV